MKQKSRNIDEYITDFPKEVQIRLEQIRKTIIKSASKAEETISYGIPAFTLNGRNLIYFAGYKNHISLYPAPRGKEEFKKILSAYKGGKGTIQFPLEKPLPLTLITKIVKFRIKETQKKVKSIKQKE